MSVVLMLPRRDGRARSRALRAYTAEVEASENREREISPALQGAGVSGWTVVFWGPSHQPGRPMLPSAIRLRNYRSFADEQRLEIRPLTLIYGENNAGKSGLLRSLPLLADSVRADARQALNFGRRFPGAGATFKSVRWKGLAAHEDPTIGVGLEWPAEDGAASVDFALDEVDQLGMQVRRFQFTDAEGKTTVSGDWDAPPDPAADAPLHYRLEGMGSTRDGAPVSWTGLVPIGEDDSFFVGAPLDLLRQHLLDLRGQVQWLKTLRPAPDLVTSWTDPIRIGLRPDGKDCPIVFAGFPKVLERVSQWYREHLGSQLVLQPLANLPGDNVRIGLQRRGARFDVDLVDTGEGITQVLPVLTALAMLELLPAERVAQVLAIEEPEAHLHPRLQLHLAERMCEVVAGDDRRRVVAETHSELLLRAIQVQVARPDTPITADQVIIYWVRQLEDGRSVVRPIRLDEAARFLNEDKANWEHGAFSHDRELLRELVLARRGRRS